MTIEKDIEESLPYLVSDEKSAEFKRQEPIVAKESVKPWVHFVAGGIGGMAGAVCTSPFDVVKTRLQSSVYRDLYMSQNSGTGFIQRGLGHFKETLLILRDVHRSEGARALFKGLGPNLVGVIPARSINFFTYGYGKDLIKDNFFNGEESSIVHLLAGINAGFVTSTATNPIWLVKTRLQLDRATTREYKNSIDCIAKIWRQEGITAFYRGLTASYLGSVESTLQWVLYEQMKTAINRRAQRIEQSGRERTQMDSLFEWGARSGAAGAAKFVASMITYPHEVVRTRLRQAPTENGKPKYKGLIQCFKLVIKEEGLASMYGGLTPHLMRTVPNSIIMFGTWEVFTKLLS